tara:strand:- start:67 stop:306 length:240 start_codon:yes stop_codon:yes gene_type:complete
MAWVSVPGSDSIWEYENTAGASDTYSDANGTTTAGVRTFTPNGGNAQYTYVRCRKAGESTERGELNKNFYDNRFANGIT